MTAGAKHKLFVLLRIVVAVVVLLAFGLFVRDLDWRALLQALGQTSVIAIVAAIVINFLHMGVKAWRWQVMLAPAAHVPVWRLFRYTVANYAASTLLPARLGELVRVWLLKQREGVSKTTTAGVAIVEKVLEGLGMLVVVAPVPWLVPGLPSWVEISILILAAVGVGAVLLGWLIVWLARTRTAHDSTGWQQHLRRFAAGVDVLVRPTALLASFGLSLLAWSTDFLIITILLHSLHVAVHWSAALLILLTLNIAVAMPSTPAQVGAFEIGALVALNLLGVPPAQGLAFALVYHAVQVVPLALIGIAELRLVRELRAKAKEEEPPTGGDDGGEAVQPCAVRLSPPA